MQPVTECLIIFHNFPKLLLIIFVFKSSIVVSKQPEENLSVKEANKCALDTDLQIQ